MNKQDHSKSMTLKIFVTGCLASLGDTSLQEEVWGKGNWEKWTTYDEVYMDFCSGCRPILENPYEYGLSPEQTKSLKDLYNLIEVFDEKIPEAPSAEDHKLILSDPKWTEIQKQAQKVKASLTNRIASNKE